MSTMDTDCVVRLCCCADHHYDPPSKGKTAVKGNSEGYCIDDDGEDD
jgi:hypothetical protein